MRSSDRRFGSIEYRVSSKGRWVLFFVPPNGFDAAIGRRLQIPDDVIPDIVSLSEPYRASGFLAFTAHEATVVTSRPEAVTIDTFREVHGDAGDFTVTIGLTRAGVEVKVSSLGSQPAR